MDRLVLLSRSFRIHSLALANIGELDEPIFGDGEPSTWRSLVEHLQLIQAADLTYPIILASNGEVMDGRHRLAKALLEGRSTIEAVQFSEDPPPDFVGKEPEELPY